MIISKIWVFLLSVAAAAGLALALMVPKPAYREMSIAYAEKLDRGQHNADLMLQLQARDWIDAVAKMAWDRTLVDILEQASTRKGDVRHLKAKADGRLLSQLGSLSAENRPQLLIAVDQRGKQISRVGPGEDRFTPGEDGLLGYPLVEAALRGYRADDSWSIDGKLFLMTASPVISRARGRYVGALLLGLEINDAFARRLKKQLVGTDIAFFVGGKMVASTVSSPALAGLPAQFNERREQILGYGRSVSFRIGAGGSAYNVILQPLLGESSEHDAFFAAVGSPVPAIGLSEMLGLVRSTDLSWSEFPWLLLSGCMLIAVIVGVCLSYWEVDAPLRRLRDGLERVVKRDAVRIEDTLFHGAFRSVARGVNDVIDRGPKRGAAGTEKQTAVTGKQPAMGGDGPLGRGGQSEPDGMGLGRADIPGVERLGGMDSSAVGTYGQMPFMGNSHSQSSLDGVARLQPMGDGTIGSRSVGVQPLEGFGTGSAGSPPPMSVLEPRADFDGGGFAGQPAAMANQEGYELDAAPVRPLTDSNLPAVKPMADLSEQLGSARQLRAAPRPAAFGDAAAAFNLEPLLGPPGGDSPMTAPSRGHLPESEALALGAVASLGAAPTDAALVPPIAASASGLSRLGAAQDGSGAARLPSIGEPVSAAPGLPANEPPLADEQEEYFKQVFKEFLAIKRQCGEDVANLTFDRFAEKLRKNRDGLVARYGCRSVKFQVYVKDGKAALKATPVKE